MRPKPAAEPVIRFETPPAHQAQVDFAEFKFPWGSRYALLVVLGCSRLLWLRSIRGRTCGRSSSASRRPSTPSAVYPRSCSSTR